MFIDSWEEVQGTVLPSSKRAVEGLESRRGKKKSPKVTGDSCMTAFVNVEFARYIAVVE